jgi:hypothetical protein
MAGPPDGRICAINLLPLKRGATIEWEHVRDTLDGLEPVIEGFGQVIDGDRVRTLFGTPIPPRR